MVLVSPFLRHLLRFLCFIVLFLFSRSSLAVISVLSRLALLVLLLFSRRSLVVLSLFSRFSLGFRVPKNGKNYPSGPQKSTESNGKKNAPPSARRRRAPAKFSILDPQNRPKSGAKKTHTRRAPAKILDFGPPNSAAATLSRRRRRQQQGVSPG